MDASLPKAVLGKLRTIVQLEPLTGHRDVRGRGGPLISVLTIGIAKGCVYALVAVGYALVYRTTGIVNFAQGCFVMLGGMLTWWILSIPP